MTFITIVSIMLAASPMSQQSATTSSISVDAAQYNLTLHPAEHEVDISASLNVSGSGTLDLHLNSLAEIKYTLVDGNEVAHQWLAPDDDENGYKILRFDCPQGSKTVTISYHAHFEQDPSSGEKAGQIHNHSISADIGEGGIFLSEGSNWHPTWINPIDQLEALIPMETVIEPMDGWFIVASGDPTDDYTDPSQPCWKWTMPRPVDGIAIVGGKHMAKGIVHNPPVGDPVEIVMQVSSNNEQFIQAYLDEAVRYLDIYTPLLGPFPFKRFTIVENYFSSGFAFPGYTLLGAQAIAMGPRALMPGYLDHEMLHNWWGNGVYVDPEHGNWCEALTSYCTNYYRRIADDGEEAGAAYRRGILMKLATDPESFDDGPVGTFSQPDGCSRFVGYEKGSFVLMMLDKGENVRHERTGQKKVWEALRQVAKIHMGQRISWDDIKVRLEERFNEDLDEFFDLWVYQRTLPTTFIGDPDRPIKAFSEQYTNDSPMNFKTGHEPERGQWIEIDPHFRLYRVLPPEQIIPTLSGTTGLGGLKIETLEDRPAVTGFMSRYETEDDGGNLLLIGRGIVEQYSELIAQTSDPITLGGTDEQPTFTVAGQTYDQSDLAVMHSMQYPGRPGRFITVFLTNSESGWPRLPYISYYTRDTTLVWQGREVITRLVYEPDRRFYLSE